MPFSPVDAAQLRSARAGRARVLLLGISVDDVPEPIVLEDDGELLDGLDRVLLDEGDVLLDDGDGELIVEPVLPDDDGDVVVVLLEPLVDAPPAPVVELDVGAPVLVGPPGLRVVEPLGVVVAGLEADASDGVVWA